MSLAPRGTHVLFMRDPRILKVGPMYYFGGTHEMTLRGTHAMFTRDPRNFLVGHTYYSGGIHVGPTYCLGGTHMLFRWDPHTIQVILFMIPRTLQVGPRWDHNSIE